MPSNQQLWTLLSYSVPTQAKGHTSKNEMALDNKWHWTLCQLKQKLLLVGPVIKVIKEYTTPISMTNGFSWCWQSTQENVIVWC